MTHSIHIFTITTVLLFLVLQINAGYWICDWVHGRGWMYCARGFCTTYHGKKRSISMIEDQTSPIQNYDGIFCVNKTFCYTCAPTDDDTCRLTLQATYFSPMDTYKKRATETVCG
ncbi:unnamed protein product [Adineta ricciae]|uniref:Uncharacterized protein n=1 Tax=Adineta ricciae TaxID=249248 RepID=A0A813NQP8_ADIRI|nr:unnamed protein product [Adineta ricciae]